jgi:hypothetical protein
MIAKFIGCMDTTMVNMNISKVKTSHPSNLKEQSDIMVSQNVTPSKKAGLNPHTQETRGIK